MRISTTLIGFLGAVTALTTLPGCSGGHWQGVPTDGGFAASGQAGARHGAGGAGNGQFAYSLIPRVFQKPFRSHQTKSWMRKPGVPLRLTYMSDFAANSVTVYGRNAQVRGQIGGLNTPQGLFVDTARNLWVANTGANNVEVFARGATSPSMVLNDPSGFPVDVTVCPNGTVYVSNIFDSSTGTGNLQVYAAGSTNPSRSLTFPGEAENFYVTCDFVGNVFTTLSFGGSSGAVVEYPGGNQSGASQLPINVMFPGGIKPTNDGNLLLVDELTQTITEYTESGTPVGNSIVTGAGDIADIALTRSNAVVGGADAAGFAGFSFTFPAGALRQTYPSATQGSSLPVGFAFDPGAKGLGD